MNQRRCDLCGRPLLRRHWWNNWWIGPYCAGRDMAMCRELFIAQVMRGMRGRQG